MRREDENVEKLAPVPDDCDAEVFEILGGKARQNASVDRVLAKGGDPEAARSRGAAAVSP